MHLPIEAFALYDEEARQRIYKGSYKIYVGGQGPDIRSKKLTGKDTAEIVVTADRDIFLK